MPVSKRILRNISIHHLMDLKIDYAFKQLFGSEKNKEITVVFLNAILQQTGRNTVKEIMFVNQEFPGEFANDKQSQLDIVVRTQANELINVEMQISNHHNMIKRTLYYWARLYTHQLIRSKSYHTLLPTITINICDFTLFPTPHYHNTYHLYEDKTLKRLEIADDVLEIHFIEMRKFIRLWQEKKLDPFDDILVRWLLMLGMVDARRKRVYNEIYKELEELAMKDERIAEAFGAWEELSQTPDTIIAYESRLKKIIDEEAKIEYAKHLGREEGREEGLSEGLKKGKVEGREEGKMLGREEGREEGKDLAKIEVVLNGAKDGLTIQTLAKITGFSEERIEEILKDQ